MQLLVSVGSDLMFADEVESAAVGIVVATSAVGEHLAVKLSAAEVVGTVAAVLVVVVVQLVEVAGATSVVV